MFHFLLIQDSDDVRLGHLQAEAKGFLQKQYAEPCATHPFGPHTRLMVWGQIAPVIHDRSWSFGIGSWIGPALPPSAERLMATPDGVLRDYDGTYCFVTGSVDTDQARALVDPLGRMHVYHANLSGTTLLLSNSSLLLGALTRTEWETSSVREFLTKGTVFDQRSLLSGVNKLAPNRLYQFDAGVLSTQELPRPASATFPNDTPAILSAYADAVTACIEQVFKRHQRPLFDLTGGFDSRLVLACALQLRSPHEISTVVVGRDDDQDVLVANAIARKLGLSHRHVKVTSQSAPLMPALQKALFLTDGEYDILEYAKVLRIHEQLSQEFDGSINGSGGELIRDEWWQVFMRPLSSPRPWDAKRLAARRFASDAWGEKLLAAPPANTLCEHFTALIEDSVSHLGKQAPVTRLVDEVYLYMRMQRWQGRIASATHGVWPNYSPLLMQRPIAIALACPVKLRRHGLMPRLLLERLNRPLANLPMVDGAPATPPSWHNVHRRIPRFCTRLKHYETAVRHRLARNRADAPGQSQEEHLVLAALSLNLTASDMASRNEAGPKPWATSAEALLDGGLPKRYWGRLVTLELAAQTLGC